MNKLKKLDIKRYPFDTDGYKHYVDTNQIISTDEYGILRSLLASFPHASNGKWIDAFAKLDVKEISKKLIILAANAYDYHGNTVLGVAAETGQVDPVRRLIEMGAELDTPAHKWNKLALHWAIGNAKSDKNKDSIDAAEVVKCLLDHGADPNLMCYEISPYEYAKERGYTAAVTLIEEKIQRFNFKV